MDAGSALPRKEHLDPMAIALLLTCCAFWGFQQVLVKATLGEMAPIFMAGLRFAGAAAVLWLWCIWRARYTTTTTRRRLRRNASQP